MPDILTLTMNPALDVLTSIAQVVPAHKLRCAEVIKHPGGGGVNVARVLHRMGASVVAVFTSGGVTGASHHKLLHAEGVRCHAFAIGQETRESFSVHEHVSGQDFRFVLPGPSLTSAECEACLAYVSEHLPRQFLVLSGGLPPSVSDDFYAQIVGVAKQRGIPVIVDSNGAALQRALNAGVFLFKPSLRELSDLTGMALQSDDAYVTAARRLIEQGKTQVVALTLGEQGAMLITADAVWRAQSLNVQVQSTIGAGDSFLAGLIWSLSQGHPIETAFRYGMAAGAAALLCPGTALSQAADVHRLLDQVVLTRYEYGHV